MKQSTGSIIEKNIRLSIPILILFVTATIIFPDIIVEAMKGKVPPSWTDLTHAVGCLFSYGTCALFLAIYFAILRYKWAKAKDIQDKERLRFWWAITFAVTLFLLIGSIYSGIAASLQGIGLLSMENMQQNMVIKSNASELNTIKAKIFNITQTNQ